MKFLQVVDRGRGLTEPYLLNLEQIARIGTKPGSDDHYMVFMSNGYIQVDGQDLERIKRYIPVYP